ncbi:MAG: SGNH/GDSL hydrolase family protein [Bacteroidota bacterium]
MVNEKSGKALTWLDWSFLVALSVVWLFVYAGFFFPGRSTLAYGVNPTRILWAIQMTGPLVYAGLVILFLALRRGRVEPGAAALLLTVLCVGFYICYGVADVLYQRWFDRHKVEYHPYLQITPPDDRRVDSVSPGTIAIFCLGGSTTEFPDSSGRDWPSRVEEILQTTYNLPNVKVYNFGRQWYTSLHTLINFETNLRKHHPSIILIMQSVNDLLQNADFSYFSHGSFREDYGHFYGPVNRIVNRRSLWNYLQDVVRGLWYAPPRKDVTMDYFVGLKAYERNMNTLAELAGHDSTMVVFMTEPSLLKRDMSPEEQGVIGMTRVEAVNDTMGWTSQTVFNGMVQYNEALRRIAAQRKVPLIDLEKEIPKSLVYFRDEVHYRDTTFSVMVPFIAKNLASVVKSISQRTLRRAEHTQKR